jgi:hypothetical protein
VDEIHALKVYSTHVARSSEHNLSRCHKTGSEYIAMAKHTGPPESQVDHSASAGHSADRPHSDSAQDFSQGFDADVDPASVAPPARFGRLALWVASASALTVGVAATLAYGVWFDQDQRAYAKAMTVAQQTLSAGVAVVPEQPPPAVGVVTVPAQQTAWSGHVAAAAPPQTPPAASASPASPATLADADLTTSASLAQPESTDGAPPDAFAAHSSAAQSAPLSGSAKQARHHPPPRLKPDNGLFARMQSFFHRVSYRQHGNGSQRDLYAHS